MRSEEEYKAVIKDHVHVDVSEAMVNWLNGEIDPEEELSSEAYDKLSALVGPDGPSFADPLGEGFEWTLVSQRFGVAAEQAGEIVVQTPFGEIWGRKDEARNVADVQAYRDIVDSMSLPTAPVSAEEKLDMLVNQHFVTNVTGHVTELQQFDPEANLLVELDDAKEEFIFDKMGSRQFDDADDEAEMDVDEPEVEVQQWFSVSNELYYDLKAKDEVVADTEIGKIWCRQACGQHVSMDKVIEDIMSKKEVPSYLEQANVPTTAADLKRELAAGICEKPAEKTAGLSR